MKRLFTLVILTILFSGCQQKESTPKLRTYAGQFNSTWGNYKGQSSKGVASIFRSGEEYVGKLVFFDPKIVSIPIRFNANDFEQSRQVTGTSQDPRGFKVNWAIQMQNDTVTGTYKQPYDRGKIVFHLQ